MPDTRAKFVWKLARRHSWGSPVPADLLVRLVAGTEDHDELDGQAHGSPVVSERIN